MPDYKQMYLTLARATNRVLLLNQEAAQCIIDAQRLAEEIYIGSSQTSVRVISSVPKQPESTSADKKVTTRKKSAARLSKRKID